MNETNQDLFKILGIACFSFLMTGISIKLFLPTPQVTLLIDDSYCPPVEWKPISSKSSNWYQKYQAKNIQLQPAIFVKNSNQKIIEASRTSTNSSPIITKEIPNFKPQKQVKQTYKSVVILNCDRQ